VISGERHRLTTSSIVELMHTHALATPAATALEYGTATWSYRRLWDRVLAVADALHETGVRPEDRVVVVAHRTPDTVAAAIAVMALRAACVLIDPQHPEERISAVLAQARPAAVVGDGPLPFRPSGAPGIDLTGVPTVAAPPRRPPSGHDIAYIVFTSGSTGAPKGVRIAHRSLLNYVSWCGSLVGASGIGSALFGSLGFDLALTSLWVPLAMGRRVVLTRGLWDQRALFGRRTEGYTFLKMTPSHARFLEQLAELPDYASTTDLLMFGGEALDPALIAGLGRRAPRMINHYGPTETTVGCCAFAFDRATVPDLPTVPIGRPAWNTDAHVLDDRLRPVPPGVPGELVIAGQGVAAGYLGQTSDRFLDAPEFGGRAYRTGDIVEVVEVAGRPVLLYLGRQDDQLKVSGHRIELGELRHHVLAAGDVAGVAFHVVREEVDGLEAFVVPADPAADRGELAQAVEAALRRAVPEALVPQRIHVVPRLVLNGNGKCDIQATRLLSTTR
jgi:amino acid adenylation domain-containing protein